MGKPAVIIDPEPIQKTELFSTLLKNEMDFVISKSSVLHLRKGALLFSIGQKAAHFYILTRGAVRVFRPRGDEGVDEMARFTPGDCIGDFDFARGAAYDACAEAVEESELIMFPGYGLAMDSFVLEEPHIICRILLNAIVMMTGRIKSIQKLTVENLSWVQELHRRAYEDPSTSLWKQSFLTDEINRLLEAPTGIIMLKPDRFKILVDSRGHAAGDEAMIRIAAILRNISRRMGKCWPLRFKSNETGILMSTHGAAVVEEAAHELLDAIAALAPVPAQGDIPTFHFTATVSWAVWPDDDTVWDSLFQKNYDLLMETWCAGGNQAAHYSKGRGNER
jgi:diguanylate cyclase (GGDEF)-like protein